MRTDPPRLSGAPWDVLLAPPLEGTGKLREPEPEAWAPNKPGRRQPAVEGSQPIRSGAELRASWGPQAAGIDQPPHQPEPPRSYAGHFAEEVGCELPGCENANTHRFRIGCALVRACCQDHARRVAGHEETSMGAAVGSAIDRAKYEIKRRQIDIGQRNLTSEERQTVSDHCAVSEATVYAAQRELKSEAVQAFAAARHPEPAASEPTRAAPLAPASRPERELLNEAFAPQGEAPVPDVEQVSAPLDRSAREPDPDADLTPQDVAALVAPAPGENGSEPPHPGPWYAEEPLPDPEPAPAPGPSRPDWQEQVRRAEAARGLASASPGPADVRVPPLLGVGLCDEAETALEIAAGEIPDDWRDMAASVRLQVLRLAVRAIQAVLGA